MYEVLHEGKDPLEKINMLLATPPTRELQLPAKSEGGKVSRLMKKLGIENQENAISV